MPSRSSGTSSASWIPRSAIPSPLGAVDVERVTVDDKYIVQFHLKEPSAAFDFEPHLLPGQPHGAGRRRQGRHRSRSAAGRSSSSRGSASTSASWCASRTSGRPTPRATRCPISTALVGRPKKEDRVRLTALRAGEARPHRQRRLCRRALLHEGLRQDLRHLAGAPGRHGNDRPSTSRTGRCRKRTIPTPTCCGRRSRMPSTTRASTRRCSTASARSPRASTARPAPGTRRTSRLAEVRSRQGQGAAQEGQGRRREAH